MNRFGHTFKRARPFMTLGLAACLSLACIPFAFGQRGDPMPLVEPHDLTFAPPDAGGKRLMLPPGPFTDGYTYNIAELKGKVVVLIFFDPTMNGSVKRTLEWLGEMPVFSPRPVKVLLIARGDANAVRAAFRQMKGSLPPMNFDPGAVLPSMWLINGRSESFCVFDGQGNVCAWSGVASLGNTISKACESASWRFKDDHYNAALNPAIELLEWNHIAEGMKLLRPLRKDGRKPVAESAEKLYGIIKADGDQWKTDADKAVTDDPVKALDLYTRLAAAFPAEDMGKAASDALKTLKTRKPITDELAAREMMARLSTFPYDRRRTPLAASDLLQEIASKYPLTPTGAQARMLRQTIQLH